MQTLLEVMAPKKVKMQEDNKSFTLIFSIKVLQGTMNHQQNVLLLGIDESLIQNNQGQAFFVNRQLIYDKVLYFKQINDGK